MINESDKSLFRSTVDQQKPIDKDGVKKYISEVVGREIKLLGKAPEQPGVGTEKTNTTEKNTSTEDDLPF